MRQRGLQLLAITLPDRHSTHIARVIHDLMGSGWRPVHFPDAGKFLRNCQLVELRAPKKTVRLRVSAYKVGGRGEAHRLHQQRIEITTTVTSGLRQLRNWADAILGYDRERDVYVGLDPRRIALGGETHNASTSLDPGALDAAPKSAVLICPHRSRALGLEYQAIFRPPRLSEYLFNQDLIHKGQYRGDGLFSGRLRQLASAATVMLPQDEIGGDHAAFAFTTQSVSRRRVASHKLVEASEKHDLAKLRDLSPDELEAVLQKQREVGDVGESFVFEHERRRLKRAGRVELANQVEWISRKAVGRGYDIKSFELDGTPRFIEVKATIASGRTFFMSSNEWGSAVRLGTSYWIYRVVTALTEPAIAAMLCDPASAEEANQIERVVDGWRVTIL